jgi:hypothetical protein
MGIERIDEDIQLRSISVHDANQLIGISIGGRPPSPLRLPSSLIYRVQDMRYPIPVDTSNLASNPLLDEAIASRGMPQYP